ncbi:PAS domain S-box protein, partial [Methylobacterium hispanicum]
MFKRSQSNTDRLKFAALDRAIATIEYTPDGKILDANRNFLDLVGYDIGEIRGRHHRIFVDADEAKRADYGAFWDTLRGGKAVSGEFARYGKAGDRVWLEASYCPVLDADGRVASVMKFATDITAKKNETGRLMTMIDGMPVAVMTADPRNDFRIDYLNETSKSTLGAIEQHLPIKVSELLGSSIDVFHKNPQHQRRMLADASHLPHRAKIKLGPEVLDLRVSAITGPDGAYIGPMLTWSVATAQVNVASEVSRVVEAVSAAVREMQASADGLGSSADDARRRAASVAANSEQMAGSIHEISGQVGRVTERTQQIAAQARTTDGTVR